MWHGDVILSVVIAPDGLRRWRSSTIHALAGAGDLRSRCGRMMDYPEEWCSSGLHRCRGSRAAGPGDEGQRRRTGPAAAAVGRGLDDTDEKESNRVRLVGVMSKHHVIITGTGRAGTTFLVQLLTELGLDTGFTDSSSGVYESCHAGMEWDIRDPNSRYIVKNPRLCYDLDALLRDRRLTVDHAIVPVQGHVFGRGKPSCRYRESGCCCRGGRGTGRTLVNGPARRAGGYPGPQPSISSFTRSPHTTFLRTILHFPRFATEPDYLLAKLRSPFPGLDPERFSEAFHRVARPELIHEFGVRRLEESMAFSFELTAAALPGDDERDDA